MSNVYVICLDGTQADAVREVLRSYDVDCFRHTESLLFAESNASPAQLAGMAGITDDKQPQSGLVIRMGRFSGRSSLALRDWLSDKLQAQS